MIPPAPPMHVTHGLALLYANLSISPKPFPDDTRAISSQRECAVGRPLILSSGKHLGTTGSYHIVRPTPLDLLTGSFHSSYPGTRDIDQYTTPPLTPKHEGWRKRGTASASAVERLVTHSSCS